MNSYQPKTDKKVPPILYAKWGLLTLLAVLLLSCSKDSDQTDDNLLPVPEGYVRTVLNLNVSPNKQVATRATVAQENAYDKNNVWVLVFDGDAPATNSKLMQAPVKATVTGSQMYALLRATGDARKLYVVAGLSNAMNVALGNITSTQVEAGTVTWATINANLLTSTIGAAGITVDDANYIPMCTDVIDRTNGASQGTATLTDITEKFNRIVAKVDIKCLMEGLETMLPTTDFAITGATLWNGAKQGYVLPQSTLPADLGGEQKYNEVITVTNNAILSQIYLHENNKDYTSTDDNPTILIIKGKYKGSTIDTYYRIDLLNTATTERKPLSISRNCQYTVKINKVDTSGYTTPEEAAANLPSNGVKYDVEITDGTSHDIVSNGVYYLGVSNSEYIIYADKVQNDLTVATLSHTAPGTVSTATITLTGTGLTLIDNTGYTVSGGNTGTFISRWSSGNPLSSDIKINMEETFTSAMTGTLAFRIGNLQKTITIRRRPMVDYAGAIVTDFSAGSYVMAEKVNPADSWLQFGTSGSNFLGGYMLQNSGIWLNITANSNTTTARTAEFYVVQTGTSGRSRVLLSQKSAPPSGFSDHITP